MTSASCTSRSFLFSSFLPDVFTTKQAQLRLALNCFIAQTVKVDSLDREKVMSLGSKITFPRPSERSRADAENLLHYRKI